MRKWTLGVVFTVLSVGMLLSGTARASCAVLPSLPTAIGQASEVFVGTVLELENRGRWATVKVEKVWKGEDIPAEVEVRAGPKDPPGDLFTATSVDREFELSKRYLFVPFERSGSIFRDNACTRTSIFQPRFERFAPASVESPQPTPTDGEIIGAPVEREPTSSEPSLLVPVVAGVLIITLAGLALYRRRTST